MFLKEVSLFLDDAPLEDGALNLDAPVAASAVLLHRLKGFAVVWRLLNSDRTLELRLAPIAREDSDQANDSDLAANEDGFLALRQEVARRLPVRFNFAAPVVPGVHFFEGEEEGTFVLCTSDGTLHRLKFPQGMLFYAELSGQWHVEYSIEHLAGCTRSSFPVACHAVDLETVIVACNDGILTHLDISEIADGNISVDGE
jgi:hypothetical protein